MNILSVHLCLSLGVAYRLRLAIEAKEGCGLKQTLMNYLNTKVCSMPGPVLRWS